MGKKAAIGRPPEALLTACGSVVMAASNAVLLQVEGLSLYAGAAVMLALGGALAFVGRWIRRHGAEDVVHALRDDPASILSVQYAHLRSYQLFRPDRHHLVFQLRDGKTTVSVGATDVAPILNHVRARSPHVPVSRAERYGPT